MCLSESTTKSSPSTTLVASMMTSTHIWGLRLSSSLESKNKTYLETQELKTLFCLSTISTIPTWLTNLRYLEKMGRERNPKFNISWIHFGLSGGSYYRPLVWRCSRLRSMHDQKFISHHGIASLRCGFAHMQRIYNWFYLPSKHLRQLLSDDWFHEVLKQSWTPSHQKTWRKLTLQPWRRRSGLEYERMRVGGVSWVVGPNRCVYYCILLYMFIYNSYNIRYHHID